MSSLARQSNRAILFYFTQNFVSEIRVGTGAERLSFQHHYCQELWTSSEAPSHPPRALLGIFPQVVITEPILSTSGSCQWWHFLMPQSLRGPGDNWQFIPDSSMGAPGAAAAHCAKPSSPWPHAHCSDNLATPPFLVLHCATGVKPGSHNAERSLWANSCSCFLPLGLH